MTARLVVLQIMLKHSVEGRCRAPKIFVAKKIASNIKGAEHRNKEPDPHK
jgi:hypothetical protein